MKKLFILLFFAVNFVFGQSSLIEPKSISIPQHTNFASISALSPSNGMLAFDNSLPDQALYMYRQLGWVRLLHMPIIATTNLAQPLIDIANSNTGSLNVHGIRVSTASLSGGIGLAASASASSPTNHTYGVLGSNSSTNSFGYGVYGNHASFGVGVKGLSTHGNGVVGETTGNAGGIGVYGLASSTSLAATTYGVYGNNNVTSGSSGFGVYGNCNYSNGAGVGGNSNNGTGVWGFSSSGRGVEGIGTNGVGGYFSSQNGKALVTNTGNVGIGTINPNLNADEIMDINKRVRIKHSSSTAGIWFNNSTNSISISDGAFYGIKTDTEAGIWIGNAWRFWVNNSGNATFTGTVTASCGVLACSDFRFKTNIKSIENSLSSILKINGVRYDWKKEEFPERNFNDKNQIGFIAQEIEKIFPEMVFTDEKGYKSVDYGRLTPVLVEAMKEQQKMINELKTNNQKLESNNQKLESRLDKLEAILNK